MSRTRSATALVTAFAKAAAAGPWAASRVSKEGLGRTIDDVDLDGRRNGIEADDRIGAPVEAAAVRRVEGDGFMDRPAPQLETTTPHLCAEAHGDCAGSAA